MTTGPHGHTERVPRATPESDPSPEAGPHSVRTWGLRDATNSRLEAPPLLSRPTPGSSALRSAGTSSRASLSRPFLSAYHRVRKNTLSGSKKNISAHYDLSNEFFELMLDETMMYSSGIYERADSTLHEASVAKLESICRKLDLQPDEHVLEIGTGWGGFAIHAAKNFGVRVTTQHIQFAQ